VRARTLSLGIAVAAVVCALVALAPGAQAIVVRTETGHPVSYQPTRGKAAHARSLAHGLAGRSALEGGALSGAAATGSPTSGAAPGGATASGGAASGTTASGGAASGTAPSATATYKPCTGNSACLTYHSGGPVMRTTTLTAIFWNPEGKLTYPTGYETEIEQFIDDVAADSGKESDFFSVLQQYYEESGGAVNHVSYSVSAQPTQTDTAPLPTGHGEKCTSPFSATRPCVSDKGVQNQILAFVKANGLPTGFGHEYIVFFPPGMDSCFGETGEAGKTCSGESYCGYHGALKVGTSEEIEYANEPDNADPQYGIGCLAESGLKAGYATASSASHEVSESVTDPDVEQKLSWYDSNVLVVEPKILEPEYGEVGDMCAYEYQQGDSALESYFVSTPDSGGKPNQTINGHGYLLQLEWDNAHSTCSLSEEAASTKATFTDTDASGTLTGEAISFDGGGSRGPLDNHLPGGIANYEWNWGDGNVTSTGSPTIKHIYANTGKAPSETFTVTLTVTDENGNRASAVHTVEVKDRPPVASFTPPAEATSEAAVRFDGSASSDPDGTIVAYAWAFGDGQGASGATSTHVYAAPGEYTVTLTVTDDAGNTNSAAHVVDVSAPATGTGGNGGTGGTGTGGTGGTNTNGTGGGGTGGGSVTQASSQSSSPAAPGTGTGTAGAGTTTSAGLPRKALRVTGVRQNRRKGSVALRVSVPGAGTLSAREVSSAANASLVAPLAGALTAAPAAYPTAFFAAAAKNTAKTSALVKAVSVRVRAAGTATLQIVPTAAGRAQLARRHKLIVRVLLAFAPAAGTREGVDESLTLVLGAVGKRK
jgi:PKD repeat protein